MKKIIFLFLVLSGLVYAQEEFKINTTVDSTQRDPQIARAANGNYIVVWDSENNLNENSQSDIVFQLFNASDEKIGSEVIVNTETAGEQERPSVSMNSNGDFIIVWASHTGTPESIFDIKGRLYKNNLPVGEEFLINSFTENSQTKPSVAIKEDGSFIVTWESWFQDGSNKGVYAQRFNAMGAKIGDEFRVNTTTQFSQCRPIIKYFSDGKFIIVWESWKQDVAVPAGYGLYGKIFNADGSTANDEFQVNTYVDDYQWFGDIEIVSDNGFIVTWCSWEQDGFDGGIYLQKFNSAAEKIGDEILVNKSLVNYQWLPKIKKHSNGNISVVWSSWRQDGSREGVYTQLFDAELNKLSFETQVNLTTEGYQWEPTFITGSNNEILVVWAGWTDDNDYEVYGRRVTTTNPQGYIQPSTYQHYAGNSTSAIRVYVVDSVAATGDDYEITFTNPSGNLFYADIKNLTNNLLLVDDYPLLNGSDIFYLTDIFEGVAVEFIPDFEFKIDSDKSYFKNLSGSNINFIAAPANGQVKLAPIDIELRWGSTDTLSDGSYAVALDTAYSLNGVLEIMTPFYAWNTTDDEGVELFVNEPASSKNNKWDPGEVITLLTPPQYATSFPNFHGILLNDKPSGNIIMPDQGDINYVFTERPLTTEDVYRFRTSPSLITDTEEERISPFEFRLAQNYPNPFNPSTTINFTLPENGFVRLNIFNVLGEKVATLINAEKKAGEYKEVFNGTRLSSGVYLYSLQFGNKFLTKKMMLLK